MGCRGGSEGQNVSKLIDEIRFCCTAVDDMNEVHEEWRNRLAKSGGTILAGGEQCSGDSDRSCAATLFE